MLYKSLFLINIIVDLLTNFFMLLDFAETRACVIAKSSKKVEDSFCKTLNMPRSNSWYLTNEKLDIPTFTEPSVSYIMK